MIKKTISIIIIFFFLSNSFTVLSISYKEIESSKDSEKTALLLNAAEHAYGELHCMKIKDILEKKDYNVVYLSDENVNIEFLKNNLSADIIYFNTHAGCWDIDNNSNADIIIGTGEKWTEETENKYSFEIKNKMIVKGETMGYDYVAFTPSFIRYYYHNDDFNNSLVYMATCYATYDDSMAKAFFNASASCYIGWEQKTVFWSNSLTSILYFKMLKNGFKVETICKIIRYGGLINRVYNSRLIYYGEGEYTIF